MAVQPADIYPPWRASVPRSQPVPAPPQDDIWDGKVDSYQKWWRKTSRTLYSNGLAPMAQSTRAVYGMLDPGHAGDHTHASHIQAAQDPVFGKKIAVPGGWNQPTKDRANHLNSERDACIAQFKGRWCTAVIDRIEDATAQLILDPAKPDLLTDPDKLYEAIQKRAVGGSAAEVGPRTFREANAIKWPTKAADGSAYTVVQQVDHILTEYRAIAARFQAIADTNYTMTEAAMVAAITMKAPNVFDMSAIAKFEACTDLSALQVEMQKAARRIDERAPTGLNAFVTMEDTAAQDPRIDRIETTIDKLNTAIETLTKRIPGTRSTRPIDKARRFDEAAGPPRQGDQFCSEHGWTSHTSERCYKLHPELAPKGWVHK